MSRLLFTAALLAGLASPALAQDKAPPTPQGAPPSFQIVSAVDEEASEVTLRSAVNVQRVELVQEKVKQGDQEVVVQKRVLRTVQELRSVKYGLKDCSVRTAGGTKLGTLDALKKFKKGATVLVGVPGSPVDQAYLQIISADTLVLVPARSNLPTANGVGIGIAVPAPAPPVVIPAPKR